MTRLDYEGWALVNLGSLLNALGAIVNCMGNHNLAYEYWMVGNPLLFIWVVGYIKGWWNGNVSMTSLAAMYAVFIVGNAYAMWRFVL